MVTGTFLTVLSTVLGGIIGALPPLPVKAQTFLDGVVGGYADAVTNVAKLAPVIPFDTLGACMAVLFAATVFALLIEVARIVLSYVTFGGGSS